MAASLRDDPKKREKLRQKLQDWRVSNPDKVKKQTKSRYQRVRSKVFEHYGGHCVCCGEADDKFLTVDHINNDGAEERKLPGTRNFYYYIVARKFPVNLQILCWNCNQAKRIHGLCPHQETLQAA